MADKSHIAFRKLLFKHTQVSLCLQISSSTTTATEKQHKTKKNLNYIKSKLHLNYLLDKEHVSSINKVNVSGYHIKTNLVIVS